MCNNLIMPLHNLLKNITSKDINLSKNTIRELIKSADLANFNELAKSSDFIFSFLKERIINDFVKLINKSELNCVFEFAKIYNSDFEDLIVKSWLKFADEDLTDKILELFENGSVEEKAYCAKYFATIKDPLALDILYKNSYVDFLPLKINCAKTLKEFKDVKIVEEMKNVILNSDDEFEKNSAYTFILAYGGSDLIKFSLENCFKSPFLADIISSLLDYNDFYSLKEILDDETLIRIFCVLIENYPENISLNTIKYYQIFDFVKYISRLKSQYSKNALALCRLNFDEYLSNEVYNFDLDKDLKNELRDIVQYLKTLNIDFKGLREEIINNFSSYHFETSLKVINEYKLVEYARLLADLVNENRLSLDYLCQCVQVLKTLEKTELIKKDVVKNIDNSNIRAFIEHCCH